MAITFPTHEFSRDSAYTQAGLDRISDRRGDAGDMAALAADPDARFVVYIGDRVLLAAAQPLEPRLARAFSATLAPDTASTVLLGLDTATRRPVFACETTLPIETLETRADLVLADLRSLALAGEMAPDRLGELAQGSAVLAWHRTHRFCSRCGQPSQMAMAGWQRNCPTCGAAHFPRTDPVVIMLVVDGDRCLLGRQSRFPPGMYSTLAGFVEPGETLEDAVRREVFEESGIRAGRVAYHSSQPWPFPMSLMVGMLAEAETTDIFRDEVELEDCRWVSRDDVRQMFAGTHPQGLIAPKPLAIAHHLLKAFLA